MQNLGLLAWKLAKLWPFWSSSSCSSSSSLSPSSLSSSSLGSSFRYYPDLLPCWNISLIKHYHLRKFKLAAILSRTFDWKTWWIVPNQICRNGQLQLKSQPETILSGTNPVFFTGDKTANGEVVPDDAHFSLERDLGEKGKDIVNGRLRSRLNSTVNTLGRRGTSVMYVRKLNLLLKTMFIFIYF